MKKSDFTKLALLGLAAGTLTVSTCSADEEHTSERDSTTILAGGCGSKCNANRGNINRNQYNTNNPNYLPDSQPEPQGTQQGCNAARPQQQSCSQKPNYYRYNNNRSNA